MTPLLSFVQQVLAHPVAQTLGWTLLHFLWQGTALGLLAWLALALLRRANPKARYGMACAFLVLMVAAPGITFLTIQRPLAIAQGDLSVRVEAATVALVAAPTPAPNLVQRMRTALDPTLPWLLGGWAFGVLLLSARFLGGWVRVQRLRRRSAVPVAAEWHLVLSRLCRELKLSRTVRLLQSAAVEVPTVLGWLRPVILLPACALSGLSPLQLEAILAHELAHIRRGDFVVNLLQSLVEVLLFYHPAVWWLSSRIRAERELCCDDVAAELCGDPLILARALTDLETLREPAHPSSNHLALAANGGSLMHRVRHLLHPALPITSGARVTALAVLAASLLGAAGVAMQDPAKDPAPKAGPKAAAPDEQRKLSVKLQGDVKLNGEAPEPVTVAGDGSFRVEEKKDGKARAYAATKDKATYTVDGKEQALNPEAKDWLRGVVKRIKQRRPGPDHERVVELRTRHMEDRAHDMEAHAKELEAHAREFEAMTKDLEVRGGNLSPEARAKLQAEAEHLKAEGAKLKAEGERLRVEGERLRYDPELKALIEEAKKEGRRVRLEVRRNHGEPGTVILDEGGPGQDVKILKRKVRKEGEPGEAGEWSILEQRHEGPMDLEIEKDIHIPPIHIPPVNVPRMRVRTFVHDEDDPKAEMAAIQAEMKALQQRLDQLKKEAASPSKTPKAPRAAGPAHPPTPPPPPPPPPAPPADLPVPPAPPAPPADPLR